MLVDPKYADIFKLTIGTFLSWSLVLFSRSHHFNLGSTSSGRILGLANIPDIFSSSRSWLQSCNLHFYRKSVLGSRSRRDFFISSGFSFFYPTAMVGLPESFIFSAVSAPALTPFETKAINLYAVDPFSWSCSCFKWFEHSRRKMKKIAGSATQKIRGKRHVKIRSAISGIKQ